MLWSLVEWRRYMTQFKLYKYSFKKIKIKLKKIVDEIEI